MSAPRVLLSGVVLGQPPGGVRRHNAELLPRAARLLAETGGSLAVLEGRVPPAFALPAQLERIPSRVPAGPPIARALAERAALERALAAARDAGRPFDLVHTAHLPAPRRLSVPFTYTLHDLRSLMLAHTPFSRRFVAQHVVGRALYDAALVVVVSEHVRAELERRFGIRALAVVPNAADHLAPLPRAPGPDAPLLHVGHLEPRKNLALLLTALARDPTLPPLLLAGAAKGDEEARLRARAAELGVAERVRFLGPVEDEELPALYARAACVVLPSYLEGFGIAALEAQRARCPLAVSSAGALPEVAGAETPCFPVDDAAACARAIRAAIAWPLEALERAARAAERYRWDDSARRLVAAWTAARGGQPARTRLGRAERRNAGRAEPGGLEVVEVFSQSQRR